MWVLKNQICVSIYIYIVTRLLQHKMMSRPLAHRRSNEFYFLFGLPWWSWNSYSIDIFVSHLKNSHSGDYFGLKISTNPTLILQTQRNNKLFEWLEVSVGCSSQRITSFIIYEISLSLSHDDLLLCSSCCDSSLQDCWKSLKSIPSFQNYQFGTREGSNEIKNGETPQRIERTMHSRIWDFVSKLKSWSKNYFWWYIYIFSFQNLRRIFHQQLESYYFEYWNLMRFKSTHLL